MDGLRFICFLMVFLYHSFATENSEIINHPVYHTITRKIFNNGNLGVNFFFVLSGFLITFLLISERKLTGKIHVGKFWIRRILRIWPVYFVAVVFGFIAFPYLKSMFGEIPNETANPYMYVTFLSNFDIIQNGLPDSSVLSVLWSVAIEEQFYLFWPLLLFVLPTKHYWLPFMLIIIGTLIFRIENDTYMIHEYHTLSCMGDMALGAFGAWLVLFKPSLRKFYEKLPIYGSITIWVVFIGFYLFKDETISQVYWLRIFERMIFGIIALSIIFEQNYTQRSLFKFSNWTLISYLGTISYGLYTYHFIGILIVTTLTSQFGANQELWQVLILETTLAILVTIGISIFSYKWFERPILKFKKRFAYISK